MAKKLKELALEKSNITYAEDLQCHVHERYLFIKANISQPLLEADSCNSFLSFLSDNSECITPIALNVDKHKSYAICYD